jgi:hypothetical protein
MLVLKHKISKEITISIEQLNDWIDISNTEEGKSYLLQRAITAKLAELEVFHDSDAARIFYVKTAKNTFMFSTLDKYRNLLSEQISICDSSVKSGFPMNQFGYEHKQTDPVTGIVTSELISLENMRRIFANLGNIVNHNYNIKIKTHIPNIKALKTIADVQRYNFRAGYLLNQTITIQ